MSHIKWFSCHKGMESPWIPDREISAKLRSLIPNVCAHSYIVCMYVYSRGGPHSALAPRPSLIYCASPLINHLLISHFE
jgi:hypothetical protein